jgi:hypothetical protein
MRPSPHRHQTWHRSPRGQQAQVVPVPKLQQLLLEVGNHLCPLLKLDVLRLHVVLKVDDHVSTDHHLLTSDVEQHMGIVPVAHGPHLKVDVHHCGGWHSHTSASEAHGVTPQNSKFWNVTKIH